MVRMPESHARRATIERVRKCTGISAVLIATGHQHGKPRPSPCSLAGICLDSPPSSTTQHPAPSTASLDGDGSSIARPEPTGIYLTEFELRGRCRLRKRVVAQLFWAAFSPS